ncbi:MAG: IS66 family insertion sequence element accessory protein TnpB [Succinivibrio sp.]|nr:IS66 family insertion sequence element accessory protein TnpB [Succinivibrio sp.]
MNLDLSTGKISLILCPTDLRSGFNRLSAMALKYLSIDVSKGNDWVVFVSKRRNIAKIIHSDDKGSLMISRKLHTGCYQRLMADADGAASRALTKDKLIKYIDGNDLDFKMEHFLYK